jgi:hypothetical protein
MLPSPHAHPELKSIETVQPAHPFTIDLPALPPKQDPDPHIAKPRARMGQIANAQP